MCFLTTPYFNSGVLTNQINGQKLRQTKIKTASFLKEPNKQNKRIILIVLIIII